MLSGLVAACRAAGLRISAAETLDGIQAASRIGWEDREQLKMALGLALVKTAEDKKAFNSCFDRYFLLRAPQDGASSEAQESQMAEMMQAAKDIELDKIELFTQRGLYVRRLVDEVLARQTGSGEGGEGSDGAQDAQDEEALEQARAQARFLVDRQLEIAQGETSFKTRSEMLMDRVFTETDQRDLEIMSYQVKRLAKKLALASTRRHKKDIRGVPNIGRSLRANLKNDGQMFNLVWKQKKINRPRIFVMCDVSGSVSSAVRFLLMFLYNLTEVVRSVRAFAFSNRLGEVSGLFSESEFADAYSQTLRLYGGGSTDYGASFKDLEELLSGSIDRKTILIILGDARSNYGDCGADTLARLSRLAGRVLWLNPESKNLWGSGDSEMDRLGSLCHEAYWCHTLRQLTHIIDDALKVRV